MAATDRLKIARAMKTVKRKLFIGPWVGEFGWELFAWHGMVRAYIEGRRGRFDSVTVCSRPGHEFLYTGLYDHYYPLSISEETETDMWKNRDVNIDDVMKLIGYVNRMDEYEWLRPRNHRVDQRSAPHKFISFRSHSQLCSDGFDVLMHVRDTEKCDTGYRNWPARHAERVAQALMNQGLTVACIGLSGSSVLVPGAEDLRGISLGRLAVLMSRSKVVVGPTAGPTHFAALCETPQVAWMTKTEHEVRVRDTWNPFEVPVRTLPSPSDDHWRRRVMWLPLVEDVYHNVMKALEGNFE